MTVTFLEPEKPSTASSSSSNSSTDSSSHSKSEGSSSKKDYYLQGSVELATDTALTLSRLESRNTLTKNCERLVLVLVGLPARGKSFLARKLVGFLKWHGVQAKVYNVGKYRRQVVTEQSGSSDADFFDAKNEKAAALREQAAQLALVDMLKWLDGEADDELNDSDDDDDEGQNHIKGMLSSECFKSERYARHEELELQQMNNLSVDTDNNQLPHFRRQPHQRKRKVERIAIFDATNSTHARRQWVLEQCTMRPDKPTGCVFIESICDDKELLMENFKDKIANSPDYAGVPFEEAIQDLQMRVQKYEDQYETIENDQLSYIKIFNLSTKMMVNHIYGRMSKIIMPAMMAWNIGTRPIFLCRPGQTLGDITTDGEDYVNVSRTMRKDDPNYNKVLDMSRNSQATFLRGYHLGGDGKRFSRALLEFCRSEGMAFRNKRASIVEEDPNHNNSQTKLASIIDLKNTGTSKTGLMGPDANKQFPLQVYTSTMPRATETVKWDLPYDLDVEELSNLNPLDKGDFAGKELEEIEMVNPSFYRKLQQDAFHTRFPGGESYCDLIKRLDSVIVDLEQQVTPTLVVSHVSVLQMLIAYFRNSPVDECMDIEVPLHTVIKFTPARGGGWSESVHCLTPPTEQERNNSMDIPGPSDEPAETGASKKKKFFWPFSDKEKRSGKESSPSSVLDERTHQGRTVT